MALRLEAVLTARHPSDAQPPPDEAHCFRAGWLTTTSLRAAEVRLSGARPAVDATGTPDLGHIDQFAEAAEGIWALDGDWGWARVDRPQIRLKLDNWPHDGGLSGRARRSASRRPALLQGDSWEPTTHVARHILGG